MSQTVITLAFEQWKASQAVTGEAVLLDEFVFANVPGLDASKPIDRNETLPPAAQIVHRQAVTRKGVVNDNAVVHSVVLGAEVGDFSFNWVGLINKASNTLAMIVHAPVQQKLKTKDGQQGNVLTRSFLMEFDGAQAETAINTPAETWQIDFTARMTGIDERQRLENTDLYGVAAFLGDGYLVAKNGSQFFVTAGAGYVRGLRAQLPANQNITVTTKPVKVWLDVAWTGTLTSVWGVTTKITLAANLADYVQSGVQHYVFAVASIDADGNITDLRPKGTLNDQTASDALKKHEQSRNHPDATTAAKGFTQLSSATNSVSESMAATPKAVKAVFDLASGKYTAQDATTAQKGIVQLTSVTDSTSEAFAATPKAIKAVNDNANGRVPSGRKVNGRPLTADISVTAQDIFNGQAEAIGNAADLNAYTTPGLYFQAANAQASAGKNYPEAVAGSLEVYKHAGFTQIYRVYNNSRSYIRTIYGGVWTAWTKQYDVANKPTPAEIGALASNGNAVSATRLLNARKIAGVAFDGTADIAIPAANVGAYTKAETDSKYQPKGSYTPAGQAYTKAESDARFQKINTASLAANGWFRDTNTGMLIQYGKVAVTTDGQSFTFPVAFSLVPSLALTVNGGAYGDVGASSVSTTGFVVKAAAKNTVGFIAMGK